MSYIGNQPTSVAFLTDTFSGNGSTTAFTLQQAPANTSSILVAVSGVVQDPSTYSVSGTTITFSGAPPSGSSNISVRFLGIPASGVATTAYRTLTTFTATSGQTTFSVPSYTVGYIDVYRNGVKLGTADFTATSGTSVVLASGATAGDLVETVSFYVSSVLNAIPAVANAVTTSYINDGAVTKAKMAASGAWAPAGTVVQVVSATFGSATSSTSTTFIDTGLTVSITPNFSSSRILVLAQINGCYSSGFDSALNTRLVRNSTTITNIDAIASYHTTGVTEVGVGGVSISFLDSPATTSATIYKVQMCRGGGSGTVFIGASSGNTSVSSITVMEIAA
jgi:hypothetical protein